MNEGLPPIGSDAMMVITALVLRGTNFGPLSFVLPESRLVHPVHVVSLLHKDVLTVCLGCFKGNTLLSKRGSLSIWRFIAQIHILCRVIIPQPSLIGRTDFTAMWQRRSL